MFIVFTSYFTNIDVIKQHRERQHFSPWPCFLKFPTGRERWFGEDHISHHHYHRSPKKATQGTKSAGQEFWTINLFITTQVVSFQNANCFTAAFVFCLLFCSNSVRLRRFVWSSPVTIQDRSGSRSRLSGLGQGYILFRKWEGERARER